jgi:ABC-2 type transport system ATP-binding protein
MSLKEQSIITLEGLSKQYYKNIVVNNVSLSIPEGCFALIGPNGAGKTTLILLILGLIKPSKGKAYIMGNDVSKELYKIQKAIGFLPENVGFYPLLTGRDHVDFFNRLRSGSEYNKKETEYNLEWSGLDEKYWDKKTRIYSRGMRQRLGIAQAFVANPKIVILDEPLSNIDPLGREDLITKIREKRNKGINVLISSHIIQEVEYLANYVAIINNGDILVVDNFVDLAIRGGFNEFEIIESKKSTDKLKILYEILKSNKEQLLENPLLLTNKIIIKTKNLLGLKPLLTESKVNYEIRPIEGTLIEIYKKYIKK